jgi:hypothetical protein
MGQYALAEHISPVEEVGFLAFGAFDFISLQTGQSVQCRNFSKTLP